MFNRAKEVNYWPSISDMFLVFFVIALVVYSTRRTEGDMMENELLVQESEYFFKYYGSEHKPKYEPQEGEEDSSTRPQLANLLYKTYKEYCKRQDQESLLHDAVNDREEEIAGNYIMAINTIAELEKVKYDKSDLAYQKLRKINAKKYPGHNNERMEDMVDSLQEEMKNKERKIKELETDKKILTTENGELKEANERLTAQNATLLSKDSLEQIVVLSEEKVKFELGSYIIPDDNESIMNVAKQIYKMITENAAQLNAVVVEIIGHTDDEWKTSEYNAWNGKWEEKRHHGLIKEDSEYSLLSEDSYNPGLGLKRALAVKEAIVNQLKILERGNIEQSEKSDNSKKPEKKKYAVRFYEKPIYFKCYSAAWLTPISFSNSIENNPTSPEKATRVSQGKDDRRIEVFIRPVKNK